MGRRIHRNSTGGNRGRNVDGRGIGRRGVVKNHLRRIRVGHVAGSPGEIGMGKVPTGPVHGAGPGQKVVGDGDIEQHFTAGRIVKAITETHWALYAKIRVLGEHAGIVDNVVIACGRCARQIKGENGRRRIARVRLPKSLSRLDENDEPRLTPRMPLWMVKPVTVSLTVSPAVKPA